MAEAGEEKEGRESRRRREERSMWERKGTEKGKKARLKGRRRHE
jgi:hypothetical protein